MSPKEEWKMSSLIDHDLEVDGSFPEGGVAAVFDVLGPGAALDVDKNTR